MPTTRGMGLFLCEEALLERYVSAFGRPGIADRDKRGEGGTPNCDGQPGNGGKWLLHPQGFN